MKTLHLTRCMRPPFAFFDQFEHAAWFWSRLRECFPEVLASMLMPDHPHVAPMVDDEDEAVRAFLRLCARFSQRVGVRELWLPFGEQSRLVGRGKEAVVARYIELNPVRKELVRSPLAWDFSTFRERIGAVADPWTHPRSLRKLVGRKLLRSSETRLGQYVSFVESADAVTDRSPVRPPLPPQPGGPTASLADAARASAAALLRPPCDVERRTHTRALFLALCRDQRIGDLSALCAATGLSRGSVWRSLKQPADPQALRAARTCLADPRLLLSRGRLSPVPFASNPQARFAR